MLPNFLIPVLILVLVAILYGGMFAVHAWAMRRARAGRDLRD
jgi:hypothetical protein